MSKQFFEKNKIDELLAGETKIKVDKTQITHIRAITIVPIAIIRIRRKYFNNLCS